MQNKRQTLATWQCRVYTAIKHIGGKNIKTPQCLRTSIISISHHPRKNSNVGRNFSVLLLLRMPQILISITGLGFLVAAIRGEIYQHLPQHTRKPMAPSLGCNCRRSTYISSTYSWKAGVIVTITTYTCIAKKGYLSY